MRYHFGDVEDVALTLGSPFGWLIAFVFGAVWGSFYNVVVARLPRGESLVRPGSHCFACGRPVRARDNIPLLSYLLLRGRCRDCGVKFSPRYLFVELLTALLSVALWQLCFNAGVSPQPGAAVDLGPGVALALAAPLGLTVARYAYLFVFVSCLEILALIDLETRRLPDVITLGGMVVFFAGGFAVDLVPWTERAIGLVAGYLILRLIADFYYYVLKREGMGLGDAKLLGMIGAAVGWKALPFLLFIAAFIGSAVSIPLMLWQRKRAAPAPAPSAHATPNPPSETPPEGEPETQPQADARFGRIAVPFGPFLAAAAVIWLFVGEQVLLLFGF